MAKAINHHHRIGRGNQSMKLDPYALDDITLTLEEWRRLRGVTPPAPPPVRARRAKARRAPAPGPHRDAA